MQHAMTRSKVWRSMSEDARYDRLDSFHSVLTKHVQIGFACVIHHHDAFNRLVRLGIGLSDTVYHLAFTGVIAATVRYHRYTGITDKLDFVFDDQRHEFPRALRSLLAVWPDDPYVRKYLAGTPRSAIDDQLLPLQAADHLVWQIRRHIAQNADDTSPVKRLAIVDGRIEAPDLGDKPVMVDIWDEARVKSLCHDVVIDRLTILEGLDLPSSLRDLLSTDMATKLKVFSE
jgi:hypothetical protein